MDKRNVSHGFHYIRAEMIKKYDKIENKCEYSTSSIFISLKNRQRFLFSKLHKMIFMATRKFTTFFFSNFLSDRKMSDAQYDAKNLSTISFMENLLPLFIVWCWVIAYRFMFANQWFQCEPIDIIENIDYAQ